MKTFYVVGGNCPRSKQDAQTIINYFTVNNLTSVRTIQNADIICIYSCGGFNAGEVASLQTLQDVFSKKKKEALVIFTGCLTKINPLAIPTEIKNQSCYIMVHYTNFSEIDTIIQAKISFNDISDAGIINHIPFLGEPSFIKRISNSIKSNPSMLLQIPKQFIMKYNEYDERFYHIRITRGCLCNCSFCAIKFSRGILKSSPLETIKKDIETGLEKGYKKFVLVGEDTGCYGIDKGTTIVALLNEIFTYQGIKKLMINDFNPQWLIIYFDELLTIFENNYKRIEDLRIPIQSGSNKILKLMRRPYSIEDVSYCIKNLKKRIPHLKIHTHIIVGFPYETNNDFQQSIDILEKNSFDYIKVYRYEDRKGTNASKLDKKVSYQIKQKRYNLIKKQFS